MTPGVSRVLYGRTVFPCRCTQCMTNLAEWTAEQQANKQQRLADEYQRDAIAEHASMQVRQYRK